MPGKVTFVVPLFRAGGGAERVVLTLLRGMDRRVFSPSLITFDDGGVLREFLPEDVAVTALGTYTPKPSFLPLAKALYRQKPDIVFSTLWHSTVLVAAARLLTGLDFKTVARVSFAKPEGGEALAWMPDARKEELAARWVYPRLDAVVAQTPAMADRLREVSQIAPGRLHVIPNPIDLELIRHLAGELSQPLDGEGLKILFVGRLSPVKDLPTLFEAVRLLRQTHPATLFLAGEGEEESSLRTLAQSLGPWIRFLGNTKNPFAYIKRADVLALSSRYESFPNVLLEAAALGKPVVSTDCPDGPRHIVIPGKTGLLTPVGDPEAMAGALMFLSEKKWHFDQSAAEVLVSRHASTQVCQTWERLLTDVGRE